MILAIAGLAASLVIPEWHVVGPFEAGSREGMVHNLADPTGRVPESFTFEETYPSVLANGGRVGWSVVRADLDATGQPMSVTTLHLGGVNWDARQDELGNAALGNVAYLVGAFHLDAPQLLLLEASRCTVRVGGETYAGDPYGAGIARSVVRASAGENAVLVTSAGLGDERQVDVKFTPITPEMGDVMIVESDVLLPDLVEGRTGIGDAAVPITNLTDGWLSPVLVTLESKQLSGRTRVPWPLAPRATLRVPVEISWTPVYGGGLPVEIVVTTPSTKATASVNAQVREPLAARVMTFLSKIDGSAQPFGIQPATDRQAQATILTLHGAGVSCLGQAQVYGPLDWATVVAPQGRRPYGFDWHAWSETDALEALEASSGAFLMELRAKQRALPDRGRVILTGQSMGGHGAWALGCHRPDLFAMMTPAAAWIGYDSVVPFTLRRSTQEAPAELQSLLMQALAPGRVGGLLDNLWDLPVVAYHGGSDDNIGPWNERWLIGALQRRGFDATLCELPDKKHWSDIDVPPDKPEGCADTAALHERWRSARRSESPRRIVIVTSDPDVGGMRSWARLERQVSTAKESRLEITVVDAAHIEITTQNVEAFMIAPPPELQLAPRVRLVIDGGAQTLRESQPARLVRTGDRWMRSRDLGEPARPRTGDLCDGTPRYPGEPSRPQPGGLAKAIHQPFLIVAGTRTRAESSLAIARAVSDAWWVRAGGLAPIVRDVDLTDEMRRGHSLILIGSPDVNAETAALRRSLRVIVDATGATAGAHRIAGEHLAAAHWQPDPRAPDSSILVLQAGDALGDELLLGLHPIAPGAGLPDYVIADPSVRLKGWGGFRSAGFWSPDFRFDEANAFGLR
jgi:predicted esterase